jgi:hypothetical protein
MRLPAIRKLVLGCFCFGLAGVSEGIEEGLNWSQLESRFKKAAAEKDEPQLLALVREAAGEPGAKAAELLIKYALQGESVELERLAGKFLAGMEDPAARKVIYSEANRNRNFKTRIVLLGVAHHQKADPGAFQALVNAIKDPSKEVLLTALRWLRSAGDPRATEALIGLLEVWERRPWGRVYFDIRKTLQALHGQDFDVAADWRNYWEARKAGIPQPSAGEGRTKRVDRKFFSISIDSDRLVFIIDVSGSMTKKDPPPEEKPKEEGSQGPTVVVKKKEKKKPIDPEDLPIERERMHRVKQELIRSVQELPEHILFTIQSFSNEIHYLDDKPDLIQATRDNKARAVAWVQKLQPTGETWTDTAFETACQNTKGIDTVFLLSDGAPYRGGAALPEAEVLEKIRVANRFLKCRVHTIGFKHAGSNLRSFLSKLAAEHDGTYLELD